MNTRKMYEETVKGITAFFIVDLFIMVVCILYVALTFSPMFDSAADYLKEGRLTLFVLGASVGMFVSSLLILYYVSIRKIEENEPKRFGVSGTVTSMRPTPTELRAVPAPHHHPPQSGGKPNC